MPGGGILGGYAFVWDFARNRCMEWQGDLASIVTEEETDFLMGQINNSQIVYECLYLINLWYYCPYEATVF